MRKIYLETTPLDQAVKLFLNRVKIREKQEIVPAFEALGRVTASPVFARDSLPNCPMAAMDGIAVKAVSTYGASDQSPRELVLTRDYFPVDTGDPLPAGFDAVIKVEDIQTLSEEKVEILSPVAPGQHVRAVGEDVVAGEPVVAAYHKLTPPDLGVILAGGIDHVAVLKKPVIGIIPTGDELAMPGSQPTRGQLMEFNGTVIAAYLHQWGAEPRLYPVVKDDLQALTKVVKQGLNECDAVIVNAGSSAGSEDFTIHVLRELGEVLVHGISTKPGKPSILGCCGDKPFLGLPGYPVAAYMTLEWFARPLVFRYYRQVEPRRESLRAVLGRRIISEMGSEEYIPMTVGYINGKYLANPLNRGAGVTMSLVRAQGVLRVPGDYLGFEQGEEVEVELYRPKEELENTLVAAGSHDLALDLLNTPLRKSDPPLYLSSAHLGSMGGIMAIKRGEAHLAGIHIFDPETGQYNIPLINKYLPGRDVVLVNLAYRMQGFMVEKGNPLNIRTVRDLVTTKARFVNRQKGAGTRILFDYLLSTEGIAPAEIQGYQKEEYSHLNVAAAVAEGTVQVGLGILPAARAFGLDFIPVGEERYDLLLTREFFESEKGRALLKAINDEDFQKEVEKMGGYSFRDCGKVMFSRETSQG